MLFRHTILSGLLLGCLVACSAGLQPIASQSTPAPETTEEAAVAMVNLALNRPTNASSVEVASLPASAAVDGNGSTRWASAYADNQWINVDLGSSQALSQVVIKWEAAYAKSYDVKTSLDGSTWSTVATVTSGSGGTATHTFSATGRYVAVQCNTRATQWGFSIFELEVYGSIITPPTNSNLALNKPINASSLESASFPASAANDGNTNSRWASAFADNQWITVDLGSVSTVSSVLLCWEAAYAKTYNVKFSSDGSAWTTVASITNGSGGVNTLDVSGSARYVGIECVTRATVYGFSLYEFEVYGTGGVVIPPTTGMKIVGYLGNWNSPAAVEYDKLTHAIYAFGLVDTGGGVTVQVPGNLSQMVSLARAAGCKPLLAIGGGGGGQDAPYRAMAGSSAARQAFVNNCLTLVQNYNLEGIDIDWEYPGSADVANYNTFMQALGTALHAKGKLLTAAVTVNDWPGSFPNATLFSTVDWLNVMIYDGSDHATWSQFSNAIAYWKGRGLPATKLLAGVPFYSNQGIAYKNLIATYGAAAAQTDYEGANVYNGIPSVKAKADYAKANAGGIMIWELEQDVHSDLSLLRAIYSRR